jgi:uncharacterized protein YijF (DUF1287 family)
MRFLPWSRSSVASILIVLLSCWLFAQTTDESSRRLKLIQQLTAAAEERTHHQVTYDPGYVGIAYPGGDVPSSSGVCSDEIVRIYRAVGIDLQKEVHEDILRDASAYPLSNWQQKKADSNIDHRRVPNLMTFFERNGETLRITSRSADYGPGDVVAWDLGNGHTHIGMVAERKTLFGRHLILHNIGAGPKMEDVLFDWKIIGHYRYLPLEKTRHEAMIESRYAIQGRGLSQ